MRKTTMKKHHLILCLLASGDIVLGAATVILAMGEGRHTAAGISTYLKK